MLKAEGHILIDDGVRVITNVDFCRYYRVLIKNHFYNTFHPTIPKHQAHITIINPKIHGVQDYSVLRKFRNKRVKFEYSIDIHISRVNFWMPVICPIADEIRKTLNIVEPDTWWGDHITICNRKTEKDIYE